MLVPATSISVQLGDAIYLASILLLALLLARPVYSLYGAAQTRGAEAVATGVASVVDSLPAGGTTTMRLQDGVGATFSVELYGNTVTVSLGGSTASSRVDRALPAATLASGNTYELRDVGGRISVAQTGSG